MGAVTTSPESYAPLEHVQIFAEGSFVAGDLTWGWQCFRCREEEAGFGSATAAGEGRDNHACPFPPGVTEGGAA